MVIVELHTHGAAPFATITPEDDRSPSQYDLLYGRQEASEVVIESLQDLDALLADLAGVRAQWAASILDMIVK